MRRVPEHARDTGRPGPRRSVSFGGSAPRTDDELLALALAEQRILITEDKDFGELVFVRRLPHPCIIRFTDMPVAEKAAAMRHLIERHAEAMHEASMIVVTRSRVRVRHGERGES